MERKIGEIFTDKNGVKLKVVKEIGICLGCYYWNYPVYNRDYWVTGECSEMSRIDSNGIIFKKLEENE